MPGKLLWWQQAQCHYLLPEEGRNVNKPVLSEMSLWKVYSFVKGGIKDTKLTFFH